MTIREYIDTAIHEGREITIKYVKYDGTISNRTISDIQYSEEYGSDYIIGWCHLRNEQRTFKISRIRSVDGKTFNTTTSSTGKTAYVPQTKVSVMPTQDTIKSTPVKSGDIISSSISGHKISTSSSSYSRNTGYPSYSSPTSSSHSRHSEGCYIATMAYGDYDHPKVLVLRSYRDNVLKSNIGGRIFIRIYYAISPIMVKMLKNNIIINNAIRQQLDRMIEHINAKYNFDKVHLTK